MQITIQKLWPASPKYVSFKGTDGKSYKGEPTLNGKLFEGQTIDPPTVRESRYTNNKGEEVASYWLPKTFEPDNNTVGVIIPQHHSVPAIQAAATVAASRQAAPPYVPKDEELITRLAILKSLIESGALLQGMGMDDLVALAWETAPKLKVWPR